MHILREKSIMIIGSRIYQINMSHRFGRYTRIPHSGKLFDDSEDYHEP